MATQQPKWKHVRTIGDVNPVDYGAAFVYIDETQVYPAECERVEPFGEDENGDPVIWIVHRFILDRCTFENGVLSDNEFHPDYPAWFADSIDDIARFIGADSDTLIERLCSDDAVTRAHGYLAIGEYHGFDNLDQYPLRFNSRAEIETRYHEETRQ